MTHIHQVFAKGTLPPPGSFPPRAGIPRDEEKSTSSKKGKPANKHLVMDQAATEMAPASENQYSHTTKSRRKRESLNPL